MKLAVLAFVLVVVACLFAELVASGVLVLLMLVVGSHDPATWMLVTIVVATAARFMHAAGVLRAGDMSHPVPLRMIGAITTYVAGLALSVAAVIVL